MDAPRLYGRPTGKCKRERKSPLRTKAILPPSTVQWKEFAAREEDGGLNFQQLMLRMVGGIVAVRMVFARAPRPPRLGSEVPTPQTEDRVLAVCQ
jgi:hypothetical protein